MRDTVLFAAVLLLGEAVRTRRALQREQERSERLLLNILPAPIADAAQAARDVIAERFAEVTVLFADIVGLHPALAEQPPAGRWWSCSNELFSAFDAAGRAPRAGEDQDHRRRLHGGRRAARAAPRPRRGGRRHGAGHARGGRRAHRRPSGQPLPVRIGIDTGPVVAGVIGSDEVHLRPVGRHREHRQPHGVARRARPHPGDRADLPAAAGRLPCSSRAGRSRSRARARWSPTSLSKEPMTPRPCHYRPIHSSRDRSRADTHGQRERFTGRQVSVSLRRLRSEVIWENGSRTAVPGVC